jgi:hypothetical protein
LGLGDNTSKKDILEEVNQVTELAIPRLRQLVTSLSPQRLWFVAGSVHVGFVVDQSDTGTGFFSKFFGLPLSVSFHHDSILIYIIWGMNNWWPQFRDIVSPPST